MKGIQKEIETEHCKAELLDTNMKVYEEGTNMRHCLYNDYEPRIKNAEYIVYHLTPPKRICKSGLTSGFVRIGGEWRLDQCKAKANTTRDDPIIDEIHDKILKELNKNTMKRSNS